ncbi:toxin-antitoxin system Slr0664 family toxin component [Cyanobacterium sp. HL-69]|uniref:type II toxin-antitoxin system RelE/ParE family toxin n=1 Tax=Cyanobacterium sp. HL-69 TaxID=2054282 RepID=UPI000CA178A8|nr:toxin-antitoxin system Slr0664 family toxin component [Cyanobacterium sp. HL-69]
MTNNRKITVEATLTFKRNLRNLKKKYGSIAQDIKPIIEQLETGELLGDRITGVNHPVFKVRVKNSDIQKGKSGGYRLIYYVKIEDAVILLTVYTKSEQANISNEQIINIIKNYQVNSITEN